MAKKQTKKSRKKDNHSSVKILPFSIILFILLSISALFIIFNKGKVAGYSLVKIETTLDAGETVTEEEPEPEPDVMEIVVEQKYLSAKKKAKEEEEIQVLINGEVVPISEVELTSSNEEAIKIEDGIARAVSVGKSTITATKGDLTATTDLRAIIPITSIQFTATNSTIRVGKSLQMKLVASPSDASIETLKYESSDEEIATVNSNGIVTGVSKGKVKITVTDTYTGIEKSVNLTIRN